MDFVQKSQEKKIQLKRNITVKKFDPTQVNPTHVVSTTTSSKRSPPKGMFDPQSSHVEIQPTDLPAPRWPPKPLKRKEIESKPWYLWTMEETTELYMGDQIRAERYGTYNPSFVKKLSADKPPPKISFGSKMENVSNNLTAKNLRGSLTSSKLGMGSSRQSDTKSTSSKSHNAETMTVITSRSQAINKHHNEVEQEIRSRRLKCTDLVAEIETVRRQTEELEIKAEQEYDDVQNSIRHAEKSDEDVKKAEIKAMHVIATARAGVNKILQHRQGQQESLREMVERQKENLRRMSIRDAVGRKIDPGTLLSSYTSAPEFENPKLNEGNMGKYLQKIDAEKRKEQVRAAVRRGLKRFAAIQKLKKKSQTGKKTVRLLGH